jgi:hypothetical protein
MGSSRSRPYWTRAEIDALRRHVKSLPLDKEPTPDTRTQLAQLRAQSEAYLDRIAGKPLSEKAKQDMALLDSARATKH